MQSDPHAQLIVNLAARSGAVKHGAAGFLYGLGNDGIPSVNVIAPLKPQVAAQKPQGGRQHPNGDALDVSGTYLAAGGREIEIYLQDVYANWPYETTRLADYLDRVGEMVRQAAESPNHGLFSFVPFNEPDQIWYNTSDRKEAFFADWETVFRKIRSAHPAARIVGPNLARYNSAFYHDFLAFAQGRACLPDVVSWHELNDDFFSGWYARCADYRAIESSLGLPPREICINEYGRMHGDLGVPGRLVQWLARFERSKVDACLAYWTDAGSLNNLVTRDNYNQATGAWWLYRWYAGLTGDTLEVTPPDSNAEGLQGLASLDDARMQARVLLGGCAGSVNLRVQGFEAAPFFGSLVHVTAWETRSTGLLPSDAPAQVLEGDYAVQDNQVELTLRDMLDTSAYQVILTPLRRQAMLQLPNRYPADTADITSGQGGAEVFQFVVNAERNGFNILRLRYSAAPVDGAPGSRNLTVWLNGAKLKQFSVPSTPRPDQAAEAELNAFLTAGINRIAFETRVFGGAPEVNLEALDILPSSGPVDVYEAEAPGNILSGTAAVLEDAEATGGKMVGGIGDGEANSLQFNGILAAQAGTHRMVVRYANAEFRGGHSYNSQVVDRFAWICVNGDRPRKVYFRNTFDWHVYQTRVIDVDLHQGANTIRFYNPDPGAYAPNIDHIEIASLT